MPDNPSPLQGVHTALVTPMNPDGSIHYAALDALVDAQLEAGIDGLVPCGTTGESATMNAQERYTVIKHVVDRVAGRVPVIAGAGANATSVAIEHQKRAQDTGAQCSLVVTPYYNKPTPEGLYRHYSALLEAADIPILLYNVPSRTGCDMVPDTVARLAELNGIIGIKEATADLKRVEAIKQSTPDDFVIVSGDDATSCPFVLQGGHGVISVSSNLVPAAMVEMIHTALKNEGPKAEELRKTLAPLFDILFIESNPIPVKTAMELQGHFSAHMRLPLCEMGHTNRELLASTLRAAGLIH